MYLVSFTVYFINECITAGFAGPTEKYPGEAPAAA